MSPISFFQRHPRADFSAYVDGELTAATARRIKAHAAACPGCAAEIEGLRVTRAVLRDMPEASAPRSFALTPEMAREARPARVIPAQPRLQPLVNGLRMTSAGLAAALVVVMVIAIGGSGNGSDSGDDSGSDTAAANLQLDRSGDNYTTIPSAASIDDGSSEFATTGSPPLTDTLATPTSVPSGLGDAGTDGGGLGSVGGSDDPSGEVVPEATDALQSSAPDATDTPPELISGQYDGSDDDSATDDSKSADGNEDALPETGGAAADSDGGGASTLSVVALVLGVLLGAALIGSIAASRLSQKTP